MELVKVEDYKHTVPYSDRGKVPVEPLLSTQWFVKIRPLADRALEFLDQHNSPEFVPQLDEGLSRLAGEIKRLVYLPAAVVGTPNPRLVCSE